MNPLIQLKQTSSVFLVAFGLVCVGLSPLAHAVTPPPDGGYPGDNTAEGQAALLSLTTGGFNTAVGFWSLRNDTAGGFNTAIGAGSLLANSADQNTATGAGALLSNTTGGQNTANGTLALFFNTIGFNNTANGQAALLDNTTGFENTATGAGALLPNTTGNANTANGFEALFSNTTGSNNTAIGGNALSGVTTGAANTALGVNAGVNVVTADDVICIGTGGADVSNTTWIGNVYGVTTISGTTLPVIVSDGGQFGTAPSSRRFKKEIKPMDKISEAILALKPVTFQYKSDPKNTPQFGLVADEVADVNPDLVVRDKRGEIYTVRYDAVNAMLLNEFLKEHRKVEQMEKQIDTLIAGLRKVSAQLEVNKPAPRTVLNNQ